MSEPVRVLHVFFSMDRGGAETMIMNLYRNIDRSKIQFDFVVHTDKKCDYDDEIISLGGKLFRIPRYSGKNHFNYKKAWINFFNTNLNYKIIHGHLNSTASIYLKIAKKNGLSTIAHSHSSSSGIGVSAVIKNIMQYPIRHTADYLFACSNLAGEWLYGRKACNNKNFFLLKNAIDINQFAFNKEIRDRKRNELKVQDKFVIGHIGRFHHVKNHRFLIDIYKSIFEKNKNSVLIMVGDGEERSLIEQKVKSLGIDKNVIFTGLRTDVHELLQAFDVFVFPSLYEGLPVTLIEAQASGLPCFVSANITEDVKLTDKIEFISLDKEAEYWAKKIIEAKDVKTRISNLSTFIQSGYDIKTTSKWYEDFILQIYSN